MASVQSALIAAQEIVLGLHSWNIGKTLRVVLPTGSTRSTPRHFVWLPTSASRVPLGALACSTNALCRRSPQLFNDACTIGPLSLMDTHAIVPFANGAVMIPVVLLCTNICSFNDALQGAIASCTFVPTPPDQPRASIVRHPLPLTPPTDPAGDLISTTAGPTVGTDCVLQPC
eukprot:SAG31_NODE_1566_length_7856_cov_8.045607_4_plen_173_part_00